MSKRKERKDRVRIKKGRKVREVKYEEIVWSNNAAPV